jgi:menaquinone-dependent protoporphyrinogen oxidase
MAEKILVVYATKFGSTKEIAEKIGDVIKAKNIPVDVRKVSSVKDLSKYSAIIFGTPIRMGKPISEAMSFVKKHKYDLNAVPVAFFSVGLYMKEDTPDTRKKAMQCMAPVLELVAKPVSIGLFGGKINYDTLPVILRWMFSKDKSGQLSEGDWRNWDSISSWVEEILPALRSAKRV